MNEIMNRVSSPVTDDIRIIYVSVNILHLVSSKYRKIYVVKQLLHT